MIHTSFIQYILWNIEPPNIIPTIDRHDDSIVIPLLSNDYLMIILFIIGRSTNMTILQRSRGPGVPALASSSCQWTYQSEGSMVRICGKELRGHIMAILYSMLYYLYIILYIYTYSIIYYLCIYIIYIYNYYIHNYTI